MALVDENGKIFDKVIINYENDKSQDFIISNISEYIKKHEDEANSVGIGVPGIIKNNKIIYTVNLSIADPNFIKKIHTKLPVKLANDALCATIAEYKVIDNSKYDNYALVTIGTGVGCGIIINGKIYETKNGFNGELGHMVIKKGGILCNCGRRGCFEKYASITRLLSMTKCRSLGELFDRLETSPRLAEIFDTYLDDLAEGLANFITICDVDMLVIGGSIAWFGDRFYYILRGKIADKLFARESKDIKLKFAKLGNDAGLIGSAFLSDL